MSEIPAPSKAWQVTAPAAMPGPLLFKEHLQKVGAQQPAAGLVCTAFGSTCLILEHLPKRLVYVLKLGRTKETVPALGLVPGTSRVVPHKGAGLHCGVQPELFIDCILVLKGLQLYAVL